MNFRTLDLNLLRVFAAVMLERNVTRAAAQLAMTQPAVSNALRRLREATGDELFVTVPSGVVPTAHAAEMWPHVRGRRSTGCSQALDPQGFDPTRDARTFTLAMADATATVLMPALADTLLRERARADVRVLPLSSRDPRPQLEQGIADVARRLFPGRRGGARRRGRAGDDRPRPPLRLRIRRRDAPRPSAGGAARSLSLDDVLRRPPRAGQLRRPAARLRRRSAGARRPRAPGDADGEPVLDRGAGGARVPTADRCCRAVSSRPPAWPTALAVRPFPGSPAADRGEPALAPPARARPAHAAAPELRRHRARARRLRDRGGARRRSPGPSRPPNPSP